MTRSSAESELARNAPALGALLERVERGLRLRESLRAGAAALAAALAAFALLIALDWLLHLSAGARTIGLAGVGLAAAGAFVWRVARATAARIGPLYLATRIESLYPAFQNRLIAAVELALSGEGTSGSAPLVFSQAAECAAGVDVGRVIALELERSSVRRWLLGSLGVLAALALAMGEGFPAGAARCLFPGTDAPEPPPVFLRVEPGDVRLEEGEALSVRALLAGEPPDAVTLELAFDGAARAIPMRRSLGAPVWSAVAGAIESSGSYRLRADFGERREALLSAEYRFRVVKVPAAKEIRATYNYPAYTRRAPRRQEGGGLDAIVGTRAEVELVPSTALAESAIVTSGGERLPMSLRNGVWRAELAISRSGTYRIEMVANEGVRGSTEDFPVVARPDTPPTCDAVTPERQPEEALSRGVRFGIRASDDVGLEELVLVVRRRGAAEGQVRRRSGSDDLEGAPGSIVTSIPAPGFVPSAREFQSELTIPPQVLPVEPGATYSYYVRAADGRPPDRQLAKSDERTFTIPRPEDSGALLSRGGSRKKRRPPLLEPPDDEPGEPLGPSAGGEGRTGSSDRRPSRSLAGLSDGGRPASSPPAGGRGETGKTSPYASAPGLQGETGAQGGSPGEGRGELGGRGEGGAGGRPGLPGQGSPRGAGGRSSASAGPGQGGAAAAGPGGAQGGGQPGARPGGAGQGGAPGETGSGGQKTRREASDSTGRGQGEGGAPKAGLPRQAPRDGGLPTGRETGVGPPMDETVDEAAVAGLAVRAGELEGLPAAPRGSSAGTRAAGGRDLGSGLARATPPLAGRERLAIPKDELPSPEPDARRPVSRTYRALVAEYFRRLEELRQDIGPNRPADSASGPGK